MTPENPSEWLFHIGAAAAFLSASGISFFLGRRGRQIESTTRESLEQNLPQLLVEYEYQKRRAEELFATIEGILKERDRWRELYNDQASGHDNAQALMMDTIHNLVRAYQTATGKYPRLDPIIETVRSEYVRSHGAAAREGSTTEIQEGKAPKVLAPSDKESTNETKQQP
jgi:hypothetical protein